MNFQAAIRSIQNEIEWKNFRDSLKANGRNLLTKRSTRTSGQRWMILDTAFVQGDVLVYDIDDGISTGKCKLKNIWRIFTVEEYDPQLGI